jgi:hypothetical protein
VAVLTPNLFAIPGADKTWPSSASSRRDGAKS